ncbi:hypothetical protein [Nitrosomonas eutropha]|nr:hypothetical protein [Nitrosomonas eutropha]
MADRSTTRILILDDPFILKWLACMPAVRGFLAADYADYYPDGV